MDKQKLIQAVRTNDITDEILTALVSIVKNFDPFAIRDEYLGLSDKEVTRRLKEDILQAVRDCPDDLINIILEV